MTPLKSPAAAGFLQHQKKKLVNKQHQTPLNNINTMEGQIFVSFFFLPYVLETSFIIVAAILKALSTTFLLLPCTKHHNLDNYDTGVDLNANVTLTLESKAQKGSWLGTREWVTFSFHAQTNTLHPLSSVPIKSYETQNKICRRIDVYQFQRTSNNRGQSSSPSRSEWIPLCRRR